MPYRVRAFCVGSKIPTLNQVFDYAKQQGVDLSICEMSESVSLDTSDWSEVDISYNPQKGPLVVECNRDDGTDDCLAKVEPQEFIEEIGSPGLSFAKRRVIKHLKATKFIVSSQLLSDIEEDGYHANGIFLHYFVEHCGGMIHADAEGFYYGQKLIVRD